MLFAALIFILSAQQSDAALITLNNCVNLTYAENSSNSFVLNTAINNNSANPCFNITNVSNIDFYCDSLDSYIEGDDNDNYPDGAAFKIENSVNITIRNCNVTKWDYFFDIKNVTVLNITNISAFRSLDMDVVAYDVTNFTLEKSTFKDPIGGSSSIYIGTYRFNNNNYTVIQQNTFYGLERGFVDIELDYLMNSLINNNIIYHNSSSYGVYLAGGEANTISNNTITAYVANNVKIFYIAENGVSILNNNLTGLYSEAGGTGFGFYIASDNNIIKNNLIFNCSSNLYLSDGSTGNYIENLNSSSGTYGVYLTSRDTETSNNMIVNSNIKNNTYGVYFYDEQGPATVINNFVKDSNISESEEYDIFSKTEGYYKQCNNSILNTSFYTWNNSIGALTHINLVYRQWYLDVQVVYDNGSYATNVNVNISDNFGPGCSGTPDDCFTYDELTCPTQYGCSWNAEGGWCEGTHSPCGTYNSYPWCSNQTGCVWSDNNITLKTNETGWITRQNISEVLMNWSTPDEGITYNREIIYFNNYSIHAYINPSNSTTVNFTESKNTFVNLTLSTPSSDNNPPTVTLNATPSLINVGASSTVACSAVDDIAMASVTVTSSDGTTICTGTDHCTAVYTPASIGTYTITCTAKDTSNNEATENVPLQVTGSGGGGGGGGGVTPTPINETNLTIPLCEPLCSAFAIFPPGHPSHKDCCPGLTQSTIYDMQCYTETGSCQGCEMIGAVCCTKCGDGLCQVCENYCNCPQDCPLCSNMKIEAEITLGIEGPGGGGQNLMSRIGEWIKDIFS